MSWFRLEGRGAFHHKVLSAGNEAYGAWCRAGQWSSDQLTDGRVPSAVAEQIAKPKVWAKLVEARLAHAIEGGYQIHDFLDFNPSSEQERAKREEMREKRRESGRAGGKRSGEVRRGEANGKQTGSGDEAHAKQSASTGASVSAKQNEAPSPSPSPIQNTDLSPGEQLELVPGPVTRDDQPQKPRKQRPVAAPSPVTEVRALWQAAWQDAGMPGPAPWGADAAAVTKTYLENPGATIETAKAAIVGMLRTPAGEWHRTTEGGRYVTVSAALAGKHVTPFTTAGKAWLDARQEARQPRREPPPPKPIPDFERIRENQHRKVAEAFHREEDMTDGNR